MATLPVTNRIKASTKQRQHSTLMFPEDLTTHGIFFTFQEYSYKASVNNAPPSVSSENRGSIVMPLPTNLEDRFNVNLHKTDMGNLGDIIAKSIEAGNQGMKGGIGPTYDAIQSQLADMLPAGYNVGKLVSDLMQGGDLPTDTSQLFGHIARLTIDKLGPSSLGRQWDLGTGTTFNPKQALTFESVPLKRHEWTWTLTPRSPSESSALKDIIRMFRINALPGGANIGNIRKYMLKYPRLMYAELIGVDPEYFYSYKPMMIETVSINYAPNNGPSILAGGRPSSVVLNINAQETDMWTREDIDGSLEETISMPARSLPHPGQKMN